MAVARGEARLLREPSEIRDGVILSLDRNVAMWLRSVSNQRLGWIGKIAKDGHGFHIVGCVAPYQVIAYLALTKV